MRRWRLTSVAFLVPVAVVGIDRAAHGSWSGAVVAAAALTVFAALTVGLGKRRLRLPLWLKVLCVYPGVFGISWLLHDVIDSSKPLGESATRAFIWSLFAIAAFVVIDLANTAGRARHG
jgi:hypothetical protein